MATPIPTNRARLPIHAVVRATGGSSVGVASSSSEVIEGFTTDSRAVTPGCAFVALRGTRDGHEFVGRAVEAGAKLVVVEPGRAPRDVGVAVIETVHGTLHAWGTIASAHLAGWRATREGAGKIARVVAITGSAGKTTTKELTAALLGAVGVCHRTEGNLNNRIGVPAVALCVEDRHDFVVFELGMSEPGEIGALTAIVDPDVAVIVNAGVAHAQGVGGGRDAVGREKGAIVELARPGAAVLNADDDVVMAQAPRAGKRSAQGASTVVTFGRSPWADVRLVERAPRGVDGSRLRVARAGHEISVELPLAGEAAAIDFVAALAAAEAAAGRPLTQDEIARAMSGLTPVPGRATLRTLADGTLLVDDSYNANPASVLAALATLAEVGAGRRLVVALGEMKELGTLAEAEHRRAGEAIAASGVALAIGCGGLADLALEVAARAGVTVRAERDAEGAARAAVDLVRPGDAVLVKGSRSVATERVAEAVARACDARGGR
jgi:UDP-N-acetylmuramoyl-tripeptide--D-alanyl-D-alanine ligase